MTNRYSSNSLNNVDCVFLSSAVAYGGVLRMKNSIIAGTYLHSHHHLYPPGVGARHQQVMNQIYLRNLRIFAFINDFFTGIVFESGRYVKKKTNLRV